MTDATTHTLRAYDSARIEFVEDAAERFEAGAFCAGLDARGIDALASLTARFETDALAIINRLNISGADTAPKTPLAVLVSETVMEWLSPSAARLYAASLDLTPDPQEVVRAQLAASVAEMGK